MAKTDFASEQIKQLKRKALHRRLVCIDSAQQTTVRIGGKQKILFCSNNYLGLANHPGVIRAVTGAMKKYGHGAGASRLLSGTMRPHVELEKALAEFLQKEAALVFPSGWVANEAVIRTLPESGDLLLLDKLDHASIIDAAKTSQADFRTYRRDNPRRLEKYMARKNYNRKFIVTESVFSMDGDKADIRHLVQLKEKYNAFLILDEAHAFGCIGEKGAGLAEQMNLLDKVDAVVVTLSKALASSGGVVAADKSVCELLVNKARPFIYTTAPTVAACAAAEAALNIIKKEPERRERLEQNAAYLREKINRLGLNTSGSTTHIIPVIIGGEKEALDVAGALYQQGFFIPAIRPPTVAAGSARLRISVQSEHSKEQLDALANALEKIIAKGTVPISGG